MISPPLNCLFVHIPKTAGQSIEQYFMDQLGLDWEKDRHQLLLGNNPNHNCGTEKLAHLSAAEYVRCGHVEPAEFESLFKFSFVRNPFERIVSEYRYRNYFHHRSFRDFVLDKLPRPGWDDKYRHVMPQYDMLHDDNGRLLVDFVGRFENLEADFGYVCRQLGTSEAPLRHRNRSDKWTRNLKRRVRNFVFRNGESAKSGYRSFYDEATLDAVKRLYGRDIETFGYRFDQS